MKQEKKLNLYKMKGWKGYVQSGFKEIAKNYDKVNWGQGTLKPVKVEQVSVGRTRITF